MKVVRQSDDMLVLRSTPWVSLTLLTLLLCGFLAAFVVSVQRSDNILLTLGAAGCLAFVLRLLLYEVDAVTAVFDRKAGQVTVTRRGLRGRDRQQASLDRLAGLDFQLDDDGDATAVILRFDATPAELHLPVGYMATTTKVETLHRTVADWCRV